MTGLRFYYEFGKTFDVNVYYCQEQQKMTFGNLKIYSDNTLKLVQEKVDITDAYRVTKQGPLSLYVYAGNKGPVYLIGSFNLEENKDLKCVKENIEVKLYDNEAIKVLVNQLEPSKPSLVF